MRHLLERTEYGMSRKHDTQVIEAEVTEAPVVEAEEVAEAVTEEEGPKALTPYQAAKLVNQRLEAEGFDKRIPPQMMYNYTVGKVNKGKKPLIAYDRESGMDRESFAEWLERYITKQHEAAKPAEEATESE